MIYLWINSDVAKVMFNDISSFLSDGCLCLLINSHFSLVWGLLETLFLTRGLETFSRYISIYHQSPIKWYIFLSSFHEIHLPIVSSYNSGRTGFLFPARQLGNVLFSKRRKHLILSRIQIDYMGNVCLDSWRLTWVVSKSWYGSFMNIQVLNLALSARRSIKASLTRV